ARVSSTGLDKQERNTARMVPNDLHGGRGLRRGLLRAAVAGAAGLFAAEALRPASRAGAANDYMYSGTTMTTTSPTALVVTQPSSPGVYGFVVPDRGVNAFPRSGAIAGHTKGTYEAAVLGFAERGTG